MKKITVFVLILSLVSSFAVFATGGAEDGVVTIGAAMSSFSDKGQTYLQDGVRAFDAENDDVEVIMTDAKDDAAIQLNQIETLLTKGVDAVLIVPVDISALKPVFAKCKDAGVKVVVANRLPPEEFTDDFDVYTGSESIQAGLMQGEWIRDAMNGSGTVGIIMGPLGHEAAMMRTQGNEEIFGDAGIEIVITAEGKWDRAKGLQIAENWFQSGTPIDAIVCNNDEMAIGALLAAENMGIADEDILIAGIDATPDALEYLGAGLDVTVFQNMYAQGYNGAAACYKTVMGESVDKWDWIPFELVTVDNMANYK